MVWLLFFPFLDSSVYLFCHTLTEKHATSDFVEISTPNWRICPLTAPITIQSVCGQNKANIPKCAVLLLSHSSPLHPHDSSVWMWVGEPWPLTLDVWHVRVPLSNGSGTSEDLFWKLEALQTFIRDLHWPEEEFAKHLDNRMKEMSSDMIENCVKRYM